TLSGDLDAATGVNTPPHLKAKILAQNFGVARAGSGGHAAEAQGTIDVGVDERSLTAKARVGQTDGFANAEATPGLVWKGPLSPGLDPDRGVRANASTTHFRISAIEPLTQGIARDVDGRVDGNARFEVVGEHGVPKLDGFLVLDQGAFELVGPGQELH